MGEKGKHGKGAAHADITGQAKLPPLVQAAPEDENARIDKLVSLTFDSDPQIRRQAMAELSKIDDPRAIFALLELSADKDENIKSLARAGLENFKEEKEAIVDLEKVFEERAEGRVPAQDREATKSKLMPSIEKLFSRYKGGREKLMPSIEKLFSWMPPVQMQQAIAPKAASEQEEYEEELEQPACEPLSNIEKMQHKASTLEAAEARIGVLPHKANPQAIRAIRSQKGEILPSKEGMEEALNFPIPEHLEQRLSATLSIPAMEGADKELEEEGKKLPRERLDYYQWAYALAVTPGIKASEIKKEKERLIKEIKNDIETAFDLAIARAKENGIENLGGLKPGMKKITTFPLEVAEHALAVVPVGKKKTASMSRILLSDGKHQVPLYVMPERAIGIRQGDLISVRDAYVDFFVHSKETVLLLGKNGQIIITK